MKNKWFVSGILVALLALGLVFVGCDTGGGGSGGGADIDGTTWVGSGGFLYDAILTFNYPNFKIVSNRVNEIGTYTISGTTVTLNKSDGDSLTGSISGNTLTVTFTIPDFEVMNQEFIKKI
jgi:hypothetical protein